MTTDVVCIASWNVDLLLRVDRPPARGETLLARDFRQLPGGKGSNAAVACARQGAATALIARIGDDAYGDMGIELWAAERIDTRHVVRSREQPSGVAQIWVYPDGDNSIAVAPGAGAGLDPAQVAAAGATLAACRVVMASNEVPGAATEAAFAIARQHRVTTLLNPAPAIALPPSLLSLTDLLTPNESELAALAGLPAGGDLDAAAAVLLERGVPALIVTLGQRGCRLYRAGATPLAIAGHAIAEVADTIGAGDTFTGALAAALARGEALEDAVRWANASAALSVTGHGALGGMPTLAAQRAWLDGG